MLNLCWVGVQREFDFDRLKPNTEQWIRSVQWLDDEHYLIICCTYAQAKAFMKVQCVEMDLAFKMVQGTTNLFSIAGWNEKTQRILIIRYVYAEHMLKLYRDQRLLLRVP